MKSLINRTKNKINKAILFQIKRRELASKNILFEQSNYILRDILDEKSTIIDVGCAADPDLSIYLIEKYNCKCYGIDPTQKHFDALKKVESKYVNFKHLPYAVTPNDCIITFNESENYDSGSLLSDHINMKRDKVRSYEVKGISLDSLLSELGIQNADYLKLDLEGIEYGLLEIIQKETLQKFNQIFIEFHHHCIDKYKISDTKLLVKKIVSMGFKSFTLDNHNYLFYK